MRIIIIYWLRLSIKITTKVSRLIHRCEHWPIVNYWSTTNKCTSTLNRAPTRRSVSTLKPISYRAPTSTRVLLCIIRERKPQSLCQHQWGPRKMYWRSKLRARHRQQDTRSTRLSLKIICVQAHTMQTEHLFRAPRVQFNFRRQEQ